MAIAAPQRNGSGQPVNTIPAPAFPIQTQSVADLQREYVSGGTWPWYGTAARALPWSIDDLTTDFGDDLYQRMMHDPQVFACITVLKAAILESGVSLTSAIDSKDDPRYDLAAEIADEAEDMFADLDTSLDDTLWDMMDAIAYGNRVAEVIYRVEASLKGDRPLYRVDRIKTKPRHATAMVVDNYMNLVGLMSIVPGVSWTTGGMLVLTPEQQRPANFLGPEKFVIASWRPVNGDPRGTSLLRSAYDPWWRKRQIIPEYIRYLSQFASPSLVGFTAPDETAGFDPTQDPAKTLTPQQMMVNALLTFRNGTAAAFRNGAQVKEIAMQGDGRAFLNGLANSDQQITKGILTQELATEQSKNQARAAAQVHQDVLSTIVRQGKRQVNGIVRRQILMTWVQANWGWKAKRLAPKTSLGETEVKDAAALWNGAAALMNSKYFTEKQLAYVDELLGLPDRDPDDKSLALVQIETKATPPEPGPATPPAPEEPPVPPGRLVVRPHTRRRPGLPAPAAQEAA